MGFLLTVVVHSAGIQDRVGARAVLIRLFGLIPVLRKIFADGGYVCLDDKDRQTKRCRKVRRLAQALDRRTHLCMAGAFPSPQS
jgi:hypothetical protein